MKRTEEQFLALLRSGLWGTEVDAALFRSDVDWNGIVILAREQTVAPLVADGMEQFLAQVRDEDAAAVCLPPAQVSLNLAQLVLGTEAQNRKITALAACLSDRLRSEGILPLLVKGQGVARVYRNPLRRQPGDIDFLLSPEGYQKAKKVLDPEGRSAAGESKVRMHYAIPIHGIEVELHGSIREGVDPAQDALLASLCADLFRSEDSAAGPRRDWALPQGTITLPPVSFDALYLFLHFYLHFLFGGQGLRQICDWARYLYVCREEIDRPWLETQVRQLGKTAGWQVFASLAVDVLGCPAEVVPLYDPRLHGKALRTLRCCFITGNFGHKQEAARGKEGYLRRKVHSFLLSGGRTARAFAILPKDSLRAFTHYTLSGMRRLVKRDGLSPEH